MNLPFLFRVAQWNVIVVFPISHCSVWLYPWMFWNFEASTPPMILNILKCKIWLDCFFLCTAKALGHAFNFKGINAVIFFLFMPLRYNGKFAIVIWIFIFSRQKILTTAKHHRIMLNNWLLLDVNGLDSFWQCHKGVINYVLNKIGKLYKDA